MPRMKTLSRLLPLILLTACAPAAMRADRPSQGPPTLQSASNAAFRARVEGPAEVKLNDQTLLRVEDGLTFIPAPESARLLRAIGRPDQDLLGMLICDAPRAPWILILHGEFGVPGPVLRGWEPMPGLNLFQLARGGACLGRQQP